jgi:uncharacterized protein (TIGR02284 family)
MTILRDELLVALNDLIVALREAVGVHAAAADAVSNKALADELRKLSRDRSASADRLADVVTAKGDIPNAPSDEQELLKSAVIRLKSALSDNDVLQVLRDCQTADDRVIEAADATIGQAPEQALREQVQALRQDAVGRVSDLRQKHVDG